MLREMRMAIVLIVLSNYYNIPPVVNATFDKIGLITVVQKKTHYLISVITLLIPETVNMYLRFKDVITCAFGGHLLAFIHLGPVEIQFKETTYEPILGGVLCVMCYFLNLSDPGP